MSNSLILKKDNLYLVRFYTDTILSTPIDDFTFPPDHTPHINIFNLIEDLGVIDIMEAAYFVSKEWNMNFIGEIAIFDRIQIFQLDERPPVPF